MSLQNQWQRQIDNRSSLRDAAAHFEYHQMICEFDDRMAAGVQVPDTVCDFGNSDGRRRRVAARLSHVLFSARGDALVSGSVSFDRLDPLSD